MQFKYMSLVCLSMISTIALAKETTPTMPTQQPASTATTVAAQNDAKSQAFLEANKKNPGVVTLPSGLQYRIITDATGPKPTVNDVVTVDYAGKLVDGTEFDSSYKRGQPATFEVSGVIPGWVEGLQLMKKGSTYELFIPAKLAYGAQGVPPVIGPNQALIFTVKLIDIKKE